MSPSTSSRFVLHRIASCVAIALLPLFSGGWLNWLTGPQSTIDVEGPVARAQLHVFYVTCWVTGIIFVVVASVLAYATLKYKARSEADEHATPPPQKHGNPIVEIGLIGASILALVFIAVPTIKAIWYDYDVPATDQRDAIEVTATGYQWWFKFEYPNELLKDGSPLVTANELVIPAGRPVHIDLRSADVVHSFWVPKLAGKVDMIPNRPNRLWLQADKPGYFWGQCAEFCGESHAIMRFRVIALDAKDYAAWLANQKQPGRVVKNDGGKPSGPLVTEPLKDPGRNAPGWSEAFDKDPLGAWFRQQKVDAGESPALIAKGRQLFQEKTCIGCHTVRGQEGVGVTGPDLTHVGARSTIAAGVLENNDANLYRWLVDPEGVKPGNKMWTTGYNDSATGKANFRINDEEARALVAYLNSLK